MNASIHETSIVDSTAVLSTSARIWHFCHVCSGAVIGPDTVLGQNCYVGRGVVIGRGVRVQNNVSIYEGVTIEDDVFLGPSMVFTNVINPRSAVSRKAEFRATLVRRGATIGANATIVCGHEIGEYAFIGAGAVVTNDVPAYALVIGNPARHVGWMSRRGAKLRFDESHRATCPESGDIYKIDGGAVSIFKEGTA